MKNLINIFEAFGSVISLCNHFHFDLCTFYAISFPDHGSENTVATEIGIAGDEEVSKINGIVNVSLNGENGCEETFHFLYGIGSQNGLEIVSIFQSVANAGSNGINVFQNGSIFNADNVCAGFCLDV